MTNENKIAKNLKFLMKTRSVTVRQIAESLGMSGATIVHITQGKSVPRKATIQSLAGYFGVSANMMLFGDIETGELEIKDFGDDGFEKQIDLEDEKLSRRKLIPVVPLGNAYYWFLATLELELRENDPDHEPETITEEDGRPINDPDELATHVPIALPFPSTRQKNIDVAIRIDNDDLSPMILDGDYAYIELTHNIKSGDLVIASTNEGKTMIGRITRRNDKFYIQREYFTSLSNNITEVNKIFGKVAGIFRVI